MCEYWSYHRSSFQASVAWQDSGRRQSLVSSEFHLRLFCILRKNVRAWRVCHSFFLQYLLVTHLLPRLVRVEEHIRHGDQAITKSQKMI